jgi:hypothetical protein
MRTARGSFEVEITPDSVDDHAHGTTLGSMAVHKRFHGDLNASGQGRMLTGLTSVKSSAGYVLIERVRGALNGRTGTFLLQHAGVVNRGTPRLTIEVLPDSGTGELVGIAGRMTITVIEGQHSYELEYTLEVPP